MARDGTHFLVRGADDQKDQSYVLGYLREDQLSTLLLPIGAMNKSDGPRHAERLGLRTWDKPDSQDVCFIEASKGREVFLRQRIDVDAGRDRRRVSGEEIGSTERRGVDDRRPAPRRAARARRRTPLRRRASTSTPVASRSVDSRTSSSTRSPSTIRR